jgi:hypothetical protein
MGLSPLEVPGLEQDIEVLSRRNAARFFPGNYFQKAPFARREIPDYNAER